MYRMCKQMWLYVQLIICIMALVTGIPQPDTLTGVSVDDLLCNAFGNDDCNKPSPTSSSTSGHECVPFYLCGDDNIIVQEGRGVLDLRVKDRYCNAYDQRYCEKSNIRPAGNPVEVYIPSPRPRPPVLSCGNRNTDGLGFRVIGTEGNEAQYGEFPWMVIILQSRGQDTILYQCGGSLIHSRVVLTAAHCVNGKNNLVVRVGDYDIQSSNEIYPTQDRKVQRTIIHEQFHNSTLLNDIALLILETPVDMTKENVGLICLPEEGEDMDGRECVASGWGRDKFGNGKRGYQVIMKKIDLPIISREPCLETLRRTRLGVRFNLHPSFICAGAKRGVEMCTGDGGSALVCPSKADAGVYVQAGIVAWGLGCGTDTPGVNVNVPSFVSWIKSQLQQYDI